MERKSNGGLVNKTQDDLQHLAAEIKKEIEACESHFTQSAMHAMRVGELLIKAKTKLKHGEWLPWLDRCTSLSARTAQNCMRLFRERERLESNTKPDSHLNVKGALQFLTDRLDTPAELTARQPWSLDEWIEFWRESAPSWFDICAAGTLVLHALGKEGAEIAEIIDRPQSEIEQILNPRLPEVIADGLVNQKLKIVIQRAQKTVHTFCWHHYSTAQSVAEELGEREVAVQLGTLAKQHETTAKGGPCRIRRKADVFYYDSGADDYGDHLVLVNLESDLARHAIGVELIENGQVFYEQYAAHILHRDQLLIDLYEQGMLDPFLDLIAQGEERQREFAKSQGIGDDVIDRFFAGSFARSRCWIVARPALGINF